MNKAKSILQCIGVSCLLIFACLFCMTYSPPLSATTTRLVDQRADRQVVSAQPADSNHPTSTLSTTMSFDEIEVITSVVKMSDVNELALGLALAMDINPTDIISAKLMCDDAFGGCTNPAAVAVMGLAPGTWFPTHGASFALLSTGRATDVLSIDNRAQPIEVELLHGLTNKQHDDLVRLNLELKVPDDAQCLSMDFAFYTVDLYTNTLVESAPQFCKNIVGDTFTAQLNTSELDFTGDLVSAPGNFAVNQEGEPISTFNMLPVSTYKAVNSPLGTTIPGVFPLLQARTQVVGGKQISLYLSIQDVGGSFANSAVALDNFTWITSTEPLAAEDCKTGLSGDIDGDGLPNGWEQYGTYVRDKDRTLQYLDLKGWGADPTIKDIFVEIDAMSPISAQVPLSITISPIPSTTLITQTIAAQPISTAIAYVVDAFARAPVDPIMGEGSAEPLGYQGIQLHVDYGPHSPLWRQTDAEESAPQWGNSGNGEILPESTDPRLPRQFICDKLCTKTEDQVWDELDLIKKDHFAIERASIFHYAFLGYELLECTGAFVEIYGSQRCADLFSGISGISRNIDDISQGGSDFIVTLGHISWHMPESNSTFQQAGTFMHELGHNLGLNHFGSLTDIIGEKPNHLSVMNYLYQTDGLVVDYPPFRFDYLRENMTMLDEEHLIESKGLYLDTLTHPFTYTIGVRHRCDRNPRIVIILRQNADKVNWNCTGEVYIAGAEYQENNEYEDQPLAQNISGDRDIVTETDIHDKLFAFSEWDKLIFTGGLLNRQRNMLSPNIYARPISCQPTQLPESPPDPSMNRTFILPQNIIEPSLRLPEELTPKRDDAIPRFLPSLPSLFLPSQLEERIDDNLVLPLEQTPIWFPENFMPGLGAMIDMILDAQNPSHR